LVNRQYEKITFNNSLTTLHVGSEEAMWGLGMEIAADKKARKWRR
jgi:hypothetical protein